MSTDALSPRLAATPAEGAAVTVRDDPGPADFTDFYVRYFPRLCGYVYRLTGDRDVARDVAQEALTRTFTRWVAVRNAEGYAFLAATNIVRDRWRRGERERAALTSVARLARDVAATDRGLLDAVERLPRRLREPVVLHYFADLSVDEVARALRRPAGSVKQRLHQARRLLASTLSGAGDE